MLTKNPHNRILALHPAKRSLGVCVMERCGMGKRELLVAGVKTFRREGKAKQAKDYVAGLLRDIEPSVLVMEGRIGEHGESEAGERRESEAKERRESEARGTGDHRGGKAKERRERGVHKEGECFADKLHRSIENIAKQQNVKLRLYSARQIKRSLCEDESATWFQVEQVVAEQYGELKRCLCDKGTEREKYWRGMFQAVAMGMM